MPDSQTPTSPRSVKTGVGSLSSQAQLARGLVSCSCPPPEGAGTDNGHGDSSMSHLPISTPSDWPRTAQLVSQEGWSPSHHWLPLSAPGPAPCSMHHQSGAMGGRVRLQQIRAVRADAFMKAEATGVQTRPAIPCPTSFPLCKATSTHPESQGRSCHCHFFISSQDKAYTLPQKTNYVGYWGASVHSLHAGQSSLPGSISLR